MRNLYISLVLIFLTLLFGCSNDNFSEATAITNVSVIHPVTGLQKNQTVLFQNDQILSVSSSVDNLPSVYEIIDGKDKFLINNKDRIAQMVLVPVIKMELEETNELPKSIRGEGGFGSTGK